MQRLLAISVLSISATQLKNTFEITLDSSTDKRVHPLDPLDVTGSRGYKESYSYESNLSESRDGVPDCCSENRLHGIACGWMFRCLELHKWAMGMLWQQHNSEHWWAMRVRFGTKLMNKNKDHHRKITTAAQLRNMLHKLHVVIVRFPSPSVHMDRATNLLLRHSFLRALGTAMPSCHYCWSYPCVAKRFLGSCGNWRSSRGTGRVMRFCCSCTANCWQRALISLRNYPEMDFDCLYVVIASTDIPDPTQQAHETIFAHSAANTSVVAM
jgi:hypothetical protein